MPEAQDLLQSLALVLCVAAVTTLVFQRLRQPVVLGYLIAGLIIGPHVPIPLVADTRVVHTLSELGVILLMFALGLEFSLRKLLSVGPTAGVTALVQCALMLGLGFAVGRAFGWSTLESVFTGAIIAISSTTIIAKAFDEQKIRGRLRELVVGVLIVEDLIAILLMAILTAVASGVKVSAGALTWEVAKLAGFLVGLVGIGLLVVPRLMRAIDRLNRPENTIVSAMAICFGGALLAHQFGYSVALGAFLAGSLIAESGVEKKVEHLVAPLRDMFAAVFFVSVGMLIDPVLVREHWLAIVVLTAVVVGGKIVGVGAGALITGNGPRIATQSGMSLAQIGEFSFIIAGLGQTTGATGTFLYPVAVAVSALTTLTTPWLIKGSGPTARWVEQTAAGRWLDGLRRRRPAPGEEVHAALRSLLPGLDAPVLFTVEPASPSAGRTLAQLDLRGVSGASVLAIWREGAGGHLPSGGEVLRPGDVLALGGPPEGVEAARDILGGAPKPA